MVQFTSSSFSGSESSGEVLVTLALSRGVSTSNITVTISLNGIDATGYLFYYNLIHRIKLACKICIAVPQDSFYLCYLHGT